MIIYKCWNQAKKKASKATSRKERTKLQTIEKDQTLETKTGGNNDEVVFVTFFLIKILFWDVFK